MAKVKGGLHSDNVGGALGKSMIFRKGKKGTTVTSYYKPGSAKKITISDKQIYNRAKYSEIFLRWQNLTNEERQIFDENAKGTKMSGWNLFLKLNFVKGFIIPIKGLVLYYSMDNVSGATVFDDSGNDNVGTVLGDVTFGENYGVVGQGASFDGSTGYLNLGFLESLNLSGRPEMSFSAWIKADSFPAFAGIFGNSQGGSSETVRFEFHVYQKRLRLSWGNGVSYIDGTSASNSITETDRWYHVVLVVSPTSYVFYIDGIQSGITTTITIDLAVSNTVWRIARAFNFSAMSWTGSIDQVRLYNRVLTPEEIQTIYNEEKPN